MHGIAYDDRSEDYVGAATVDHDHEVMVDNTSEQVQLEIGEVVVGPSKLSLTTAQVTITRLRMSIKLPPILQVLEV